jgi:hypothetical protein
MRLFRFASVAALMLSLAGSVRADVNYSYTLDGESAGFIGRGDVISHPDLGKEALVENPTVRLQVQQTYEIKGTVEVTVETQGKPSTRIMVDIVGTYSNVKTYNVNTKVVVVSRKSKGNDNINGYLLGDVDPNSTGGQKPPQVGDELSVNANNITIVSATQQSDGQPYTGNLNIFNGNHDVLVTDVELLESGQETLTFHAGGELLGAWLLDEFGDGYLP